MDKQDIAAVLAFVTALVVGLIITLFSGFDDDESVIDNHCRNGQLNLGTDHLKVAHRMRVTGLIRKSQRVRVSLVLDNGTPVSTFTSRATRAMSTPASTWRSVPRRSD